VRPPPGGEASALQTSMCGGPGKGRLPPAGFARAGPLPWGFTLSDDDLIKEARDAFQLAADAEAENRRDALDDIRFARLGEQWPQQVKRERELEGRPVLTINRLP